MTDLLTRLTTCRRPKLLIRAARIGSLDYARKQALSRLLGVEGALAPAPALTAFMELETELDTQRRAKDAAYSVARHVEVLVAVMGEARLLSAQDRPAPDTAPDTGSINAAPPEPALQAPENKALKPVPMQPAAAHPHLTPIG